MNYEVACQEEVMCIYMESSIAFQVSEEENMELTNWGKTELMSSVHLTNSMCLCCVLGSS